MENKTPIRRIPKDYTRGTMAFIPGLPIPLPAGSRYSLTCLDFLLLFLLCIDSLSFYPTILLIGYLHIIERVKF